MRPYYVPFRLLESSLPRMSGSSAKVLLSLAARASNDEQCMCYPPRRQIMDDTGLSEETVDQSISLLERLGILNVERSKNRNNVYRLTVPVAPEKTGVPTPENTGYLPGNIQGIYPGKTGGGTPENYPSNSNRAEQESDKHEQDEHARAGHPASGPAAPSSVPALPPSASQQGDLGGPSARSISPADNPLIAAPTNGPEASPTQSAPPTPKGSPVDKPKQVRKSRAVGEGDQGDQSPVQAGIQLVVASTKAARAHNGISPSMVAPPYPRIGKAVKNYLNAGNTLEQLDDLLTGIGTYWPDIIERLRWMEHPPTLNELAFFSSNVQQQYQAILDTPDTDEFVDTLDGPEDWSSL